MKTCHRSRVSAFALASVVQVLAGCGGTDDATSGGPVALAGEGRATVDITPGTGTATPRGPGEAGASALVGQQVMDSIVPLTIADVPVKVTARADGTTVTYEKVCVTMDLCQYYDDNELGVARKTVPSVVDIQHFASTFTWKVTAPVLADGAPAGELVIDVAPQRFDSLDPIAPCPTDFCSTESVTATGARVVLEPPTFSGEIAVEIELLQQSGTPFGGSDVVKPLTGVVSLTPIVDPATKADVSSLSLPL